MKNKIEEMRMTTMKRSLGNALIKRTQSNSEAWSKGTTPMTLPNEDTSEQPSTKKRCCKQTTMNYKGDIKLHGYFGFLHEGPWLHNNVKVSEKVELYDFK